MDLASKKCVPCEGHEKPFTRGQAEEYLKAVNGYERLRTAGKSRSFNKESSRLTRTINGWEMADDGILKIHKKFKFKNFKEALEFVNKVGAIAESEGHHPDINFGWGRVEITLYTHAIGGLSENDFILAAKINKLQQEHKRSEAK